MKDEKPHGERIASLETAMSFMAQDVSEIKKAIIEVTGKINRGMGIAFAFMLLGGAFSGIASEVLHHVWK